MIFSEERAMTDSKKKKNSLYRSDYGEAVLSAGNGSPGEIRIATTALASVIRHAACSVDGVSRIAGNSLVDNIAEFVGSRKVLDRAIQIKIDGDSIEVVIAINIQYGFSLPEIAGNVQEAVVQQIREFTGLQAARVDVIIREMELPGEEDEE